MNDQTTLSFPDDADARALIDDIAGNIDAWAFFLDIDGTLVDLAPTPDTIQVETDLPTNLHNLSVRLNGALALVTGRAMAYADGLFKPYQFPVAGLHGAEMRLGDGSRISPPVPPAFAALKLELARRTSHMKGVLIEDKGAAVAAHYRLAPEFEEPLLDLMRHYEEQAGEGWVLQLGKMVYEIRPSQSSKGDAVDRYLRETAFAGRRPLAIGDDLTDESMFSVVNKQGGASIRVGSADVKTIARARMPSPQSIRDMIASLATAKS